MTHRLSDALTQKSSLEFIWDKNKKKRSLSIENIQNVDEPRSTQFQITQEDTEMNTTNHLESSFMVIYFVNSLYYICHYDPMTLLLQFLEPVQNTKDDEDVIKTILNQFKPARIMYNSKAQMQLKLDSQQVDYDIKLDVKSSKDFISAEGECFIDSLTRELNRIEEDHKIVTLKNFICRLEILDDYVFYCSLLAIVSLEYEIRKMGQSVYKKHDMIHTAEFVQMETFMNIDLESMISLSVVNVDKSNSRKTLFGLFDRCASKMGNILLQKILMRPLFDTNEINKRLDTVECIIVELEAGRKQSLIRKISDCIRGTSDIARIIHNLRIGNFEATVWKQLRNFLINIVGMKELIESSPCLMGCQIFANLVESFIVDDIQSIRLKLETVLDFDSDIDSLCIQNNYDETLQNYKDTYDEMEKILSNISRNLKNMTRLDIVTAYIPQFGYLIAIEKSEHSLADVVNFGFDLIFNTSTTSYYKNNMMVEMDSKYGDLHSLIRDKEIEILFNLKNKVLDKIKKLVYVYKHIGYIDVLICFATVSVDNKFNKPILISNDEANSKVINLKGSFHPLINKSNFISNDIKISDSKVIVITGANYSGKSTILTQLGLTIYLAQVGCYIPAMSGELSIFKNILTRINTLESINTNLSTFMKDCQQISKCVYKSDENSLVLIDEFGKGTDVNDGPGLLGGIINFYLNKKEKCPVVLLCTHMTDIFDKNLIDMNKPLLDFRQMKIIVENKKSFKLTFLYELIDGLAKNSDGLYCAKQSGIDIEIIERAHYILTLLESGENIVDELSRLSEYETMIIKDHRARIKKVLELNFQDWKVQDAKKLKNELLKILK